MYEELYERIPDAAAYLRRLGLSCVPLSREGLDLLVAAHQCRIPFEALDAFPGARVPPLGIEENFRRIVLGKRGGYCFQLNGLFCALLTELGFDAYSVAVKILRMGPHNPRLHRGVVVRLNGQKFYCDVGFGGPGPERAVLLEAGARTDNFSVALRNGDTEIWRDEDRENPLFSFIDHPADPVEFLPPNFYCARAPQSRFAQIVVVNQRRENGQRSITGNVLHIREGDSVEETIIRDEELSDVLREYFDILYP